MDNYTETQTIGIFPCCYIYIQGKKYGPFIHKNRVLEFLYKQILAGLIPIEEVNKLLWPALTKLNSDGLAIYAQACLDLNASIPVFKGTPECPVYE